MLFLEFENDIVGLCEIGSRHNKFGFFVEGKWSDNIKLLIDFSDRVTVVVQSVNEKEFLAVIRVNAPSATDDDEMYELHDDLQKAQNEFKNCTWI